MEGIINKELFDFYLQEVSNDFKGWDFSYISKSGRMVEFPLSWNYINEILHYIGKSSSLLDMGTGGGEFLSSIKHILPKGSYATEGYEPNIKIARDRLEPIGIKVSPVYDDENLPFDDTFFDLIINRHESYSPSEVKRILQPKGIFITQQVGGLNDKDINDLLGAKESEYIDWKLNRAINGLEKVGFNIIKQKEDITKTRFYDIGAIIYYLKAIPWQVPDFTVDKYRIKLISIHNYIQETGYIDVTCHRFLIIGRK